MKLQNPRKIQKAAIYARVSTKDKGKDKSPDKGQDTENQAIQLREYCKDWNVVEFTDRVSAKRSDNRKQFQAMLDAASRREFDVVVVWALDRFSREGIAQTFEHIKKLKSYGVEFESYTEPHFRTTGPAGELMIAVAAWIADQESKRIGERTRAGMERARLTGTRSGKSIGRPRVIVDRDKIKALHAQGMGMRAIGKQLKIATMTVLRILRAA